MASVGFGAAFAVAETSAPQGRRFGLTLVVLALTVWSSFLFHAHLKDRTRLLMANCWKILKEDEMASAALERERIGKR